MKKIKSLLLSLIVFSFFLPIGNAQLAQDFNLNQTHDWLSIISDSGLKLDTEIKPELKAEPVLQKSEKIVSKLYIGRDISPKMNDQGRVDGILALIKKIVNNEHLQYSADGQTFGNREKVLPIEASGFYKEYTFIPPKGSHYDTITIGGKVYDIYTPIGARGAERLVIGGNEIVYYTPDHYKNFIRLEIIK
jgi:ribonuclease